MCSPPGPGNSGEHAAVSLSGIFAVATVEAAGGEMTPCIEVAHDRAGWVLGFGIQDWARMEALQLGQ